MAVDERVHDALAVLGAGRIAVATPNVEDVDRRLEAFLAEAGIATVSNAGLGLDARIWEVDYETTRRLVEAADHPDAEAVFVSCTSLATFDLIAMLETALGKAVLTAKSGHHVASDECRRARAPRPWTTAGRAPGGSRGGLSRRRCVAKMCTCDVGEFRGT